MGLVRIGKYKWRLRQTNLRAICLLVVESICEARSYLSLIVAVTSVELLVDVSRNLFFFIFVLVLYPLLLFELLDDKANWFRERVLDTKALTTFIFISTTLVVFVRHLVIAPNIHFINYWVDLACLPRY